MFSDCKFRQAWHGYRASVWDDKEGFHGGHAGQRLVQLLDGRFGANRPPGCADTLLLEIGGDGVQLSLGNHTTMVMGVRCEDLPPEVSHSKTGWRILLIVEGPKECTNLNYVLQPTVDKLLELCPRISGAGLPLQMGCACARKFSTDTMHQHLVSCSQVFQFCREGWQHIVCRAWNCPACCPVWSHWRCALDCHSSKGMWPCFFQGLSQMFSVGSDCQQQG
jgi:hypothetical protein